MLRPLQFLVTFLDPYSHKEFQAEANQATPQVEINHYYGVILNNIMFAGDWTFNNQFLQSLVAVPVTNIAN